MKLNDRFVLRQVADTWVLLPLSQDTLNFNELIRLNGSGALLWQSLEQGADRDGLIRTLTSRYDVSALEAGTDVDEFLQMLQKIGCLDD